MSCSSFLFLHLRVISYSLMMHVSVFIFLIFTSVNTWLLKKKTWNALDFLERYFEKCSICNWMIKTKSQFHPILMNCSFIHIEELLGDVNSLFYHLSIAVVFLKNSVFGNVLFSWKYALADHITNLGEETFPQINLSIVSFTFLWL